MQSRISCWGTVGSGTRLGGEVVGMVFFGREDFGPFFRIVCLEVLAFGTGGLDVEG